MLAFALMLAAVPQEAPRNPAEPRGLNTDRPDTTESPFTVPKGWVQVELSLAEYARSRDGSRTLDVLPVNLKVGLTDSVDIQFLATPYTRVTDRGASVGGFGDDTQVRLKVNLWGDDGGRTAFAVMPFVKLPTAKRAIGNGRVEGGLILPLGIDLGGDVSLTTMAEFDLTWDEGRQDYGIDVVHTASLGVPIRGTLAGYIEYVGIAPRPGGGKYQAIASSGFTYKLADDWQLDAGGTAGMSGDSDRWRMFAGVSTRFR